MNIKLTDVKEDLDFIILEQINSEFKGIILVFSRDNPIGYIVYDYDCDEWAFINCINVNIRHLLSKSSHQIIYDPIITKIIISPNNIQNIISRKRLILIRNKHIQQIKL